MLKTAVPCDSSVTPAYNYNETLSMGLPFTDTLLLSSSSPSSSSPPSSYWLPCVSWFPCVYKRMLRWFPRLQVATACFSRSPPDLNFLYPYFISMYVHNNNCHRATAHLQLNILLSLSSSSLSEPMYIHEYKVGTQYYFKTPSLQRTCNSLIYFSWNTDFPFWILLF